METPSSKNDVVYVLTVTSKVTPAFSARLVSLWPSVIPSPVPCPLTVRGFFV